MSLHKFRVHLDSRKQYNYSVLQYHCINYIFILTHHTVLSLHRKELPELLVFIHIQREKAPPYFVNDSDFTTFDWLSLSTTSFVKPIYITSLINPVTIE